MTASSGYDRIKEHLDLYRSDPNKAHDWKPYGKVVPTLLLVSKGSKTGKLRTRPLVYSRTGSSYVIVASKGGSPKHPAWYTNLVVNPECTIQVRDAVTRVRARTASGAERDRLWAEMVDVLPQYEEYQAHTDRQLPVVVLDPTDAQPSPSQDPSSQ